MYTNQIHRRYGRGELAYKILATVAKGTLITAMVLVALSGTGSCRRKQSHEKSIKEIEEEENRKSYYVTLYRLKKQGMLVKNGGKWKIAQKGMDYIEKIREKVPIWKIQKYPKMKINTKIIVAFDIPERFRHKRATLRGALTSLEFSMLQKSLWIGSNKIPKKLLIDLKEWGIIKYVHIFEVTREGTIKG